MRAYLDLPQISFQKPKAFLDGAPFNMILGGIVNGIRQASHCRSSAFRKQRLKSHSEFCLFSKVKRIDLSDYKSHKGQTIRITGTPSLIRAPT